MDFGLGGIDYGAIFGPSAVGQNEGMNPSNLMSMALTPSPQSNPGTYQPGGSFYNGFTQYGQQYVLPYNPGTINAKVNQSVQAPSMSSALQSMPANNGVAHNSPARMYLASMRSVAPTVGQNAGIRAMLPLQYGAENARSLLSQQGGYDDYNLALMANQQSQSQQGLGMVMQLLSPFLGTLLNGAE